MVPGETGLVVPHGDVAALASAMGRVTAHPTEKEKWEAAAVERARGYSWEAASARTLEVLEGAAEGER